MSPGQLSAHALSGALLLLEVERVWIRVALVLLCIHLLRSLWLSRRDLALSEVALPDATQRWPRVTVQLPIRNEFYVVERMLRTICALDYPRDRLEFQVLDDSDDETRGLVDRIVLELQSTGIPISTLRRPTNQGFKAGALAYGLASAQGELIAIFDADCLPSPDFLRRMVPLFLNNPQLGLAQGSWSFLNRTHSLLTRAQAAWLDGLMQIEQTARSNSRTPFQFNGTAGIWRRACIDAAGGWSSGSVAEDLELSMRALLQGWRFIHCRSLAVATELPESFAALRTQQRRWAQGSAQALALLGFRILRAHRPPAERLGMLLHLGRRVVQALIALWLCTLPFTTFGWLPGLVDYGTRANILLFSSVVLCGSLFLIFGQRRAGVGLVASILAVPLVIALYISLSFSIALAYTIGLFRRETAFIRTPKSGDAPANSGSPRGPRYTSPFDLLSCFEAALGVIYVRFALLAAAHGTLLFAALFGFIALCLLAVGVGTLGEQLRLRFLLPSREPSPPSPIQVSTTQRDL